MQSELNIHTSWRQSLLAPRVWKSGAWFGLPAGLIQAALNQGDCWLAGHVTTMVVAKTIASPLVGFGVAYVSAVTTHHESSRVHSQMNPEPATATAHGLS
jgi:hypothetical protein